jgi:NAD(P)-dependent dehydrogenase (short-subunit alcohol dehydrogenase family)
MGRLDNKVAVITGTGSGMGAAHAKVFAREGAKVVITDINEANMEKTAEAIRNAGGVVAAIKADASKRESWDALTELALSKFGKIDVLINNAGMARLTNLIHFDQAEWDLVLGVQFWGPVYGMTRIYPEMKKNGGGSIINVISLSTFTAMGGSGPYTAAKSAIWGLTRAAASEMAPDNVRVNALLPGILKTNLLPNMDNLDDPWVAQEANRIKMRTKDGRPWLGEPEYASYVALFYASDESKYITGTYLPIDGGYLTY